LKPQTRAALRARVLATCRRLIQGGTVPSEKLLHVAIPEWSATLLADLRNELRDDDKLDWSHLQSKAKCYQARGLAEADWRRVQDAIAEIRREKIAAGPPNVAEATIDELVAKRRVYRVSLRR